MRIPATKLAAIRISKGIQQKELAALCGIAQATLSAVENGHNRAWPKLRRDTARILGVPEVDLFDDVPARTAR